MNRFLEIFQDNKGRMSAYRLAFLVWMIGVFFVWGWVSYTNNKLADLPQTVVNICGFTIAGKVGQSYTERKTSTTTTPATSTSPPTTVTNISQ